MSILFPSRPRAVGSADEEPGGSQQGNDRDRRTKRLDGEEGERSGRSSPQEKKEGEEEAGKDEATEAVLTEEDLIQQSQAEYDSGRYSPTLLQPSELPLDTHLINVEEDLQRLQLARKQLQVTGAYHSAASYTIVKFTIFHSETHTTCFKISVLDMQQEER